ncbi:hypothetical protein GCM10011321_41100 [Youhaiella tibetensis]|uniref:Uncharacterized protein n=1 Tax=Paradevosia tibetensis TaxID=1447062 RepID=A0A5B9DUF4_9HYPH|nr:hypothetical protein [Youhaiella tibetensis]QEE21984.1 hypothetical protein FNA67_18170 [Youhaiella tibetensis]GGF46405.1 hypothetical protein GCM10011321_41100 [Youhaiella tibetensis]
MDLLFQICLVAHLLALMVAGGSVVALPIVGRELAGAGPEVGKRFGGIAQLLGRNSRAAFGVLILTGILMVWLRYGGVDGIGVWFWVKMGLVVIVAIAMGAGGRFRAQGMRQAANVAAWVSRLALLGVIIAAVLAFS